jgi:hypothetical protein
LVIYFFVDRDKVNKIQLAFGKGKSTRVIASSEDNTVRIFNRDTTRALTTVLPIPKSNSAKIHSCMYSRNCNILYLLLDDNEIWLYFTKYLVVLFKLWTVVKLYGRFYLFYYRTSPATHICVWNALKLQANKDNMENSKENKDTNKTCIRPPKPIQLTTQNLLVNHRAIEYGLFNHEKPIDCTCICVIESPVIFYNEEGACCPIVKTFLLLGLQVNDENLS